MRATAQIAGAMLLLMLGACNIAAPVHVKPTVEDCQAALLQINKDMGNVIAAESSMMEEDLAPLGAHRHIKEWWEQKIGLLGDVASIASAVGNK